MNLIEITEYKNFQFAAEHVGSFDPKVRLTVSDIITDIIENGDSSLLKYTKQFDSVQLESIRVPFSAIKEAENKMDSAIKTLLSQAIKNIQAFHQSQILESWNTKFDDGTVLGEIVRPLDRVGIYVPGGKGFYPSTMIMNAIPAKIAGVPSIAIASPPTAEGLPHPLVLGICSMLKIDEIYSLGGIQAIAAMAYGSESVQPVCKITGPGNSWVQEAKRQVFGRVGIDSIAGPSEILILHDDETIPIEYLGRDLLTQAEHSEDATAILITTSRKTATAVQAYINQLVPQLPRKEIITESLRQLGGIVLVDRIEDGINLVNEIAPEHLEVLIKDETKLDEIRNAGAMFIGQWSTETVGDYFAGPNHTIPTGGAARFGSPLSVRDFIKHSSYINYSKQRLVSEGEQIAKFAELEGFYAHAAAVRERIK